MSTRFQGGYVGLLALLVSLAACSALFVWWYFSPRAVPPAADEGLQPMAADGSVPETRMEQYQADIDAAKNVQNMVNVREGRTSTTDSMQ